MNLSSYFFLILLRPILQIETLQVTCENFGNLSFLCGDSFILESFFREFAVVYAKSEGNVTRVALTMFLLIRPAMVLFNYQRSSVVKQ